MLRDILYVANIVENTIVDGEGFRTSLYLSGCDIHCLDCHNKDWWSLERGLPMQIQDVFDKITCYFTNITFIGGEPMMQAENLSLLAEMIKNKTNKNIWLYSGHTYEEILANRDYYNLLKYCDVLVDGKYNSDLFVNNLKFKGSTNQRIIDIRKSISNDNIISWQEDFSFSFC